MNRFAGHEPSAKRETSAEWLKGPRVRIDSLPLDAHVLSMDGDRGVIVGSLVKLEPTIGVRGDCPVVRLDGGRQAVYAGCADVVALYVPKEGA